MTDADDEGLIKELRNPVYGPQRGHFLDGARLDVGRTFEVMQKAADRLEAQGKEIAELRLERDTLIDLRDNGNEMPRSGVKHSWWAIATLERRGRTKAEAALAEALKVIAPFAPITAHNATFHYTSDTPAWSFNGELITWGDLSAAAAFAKKHGGKDD